MRNRENSYAIIVLLAVCFLLGIASGGLALESPKTMNFITVPPGMATYVISVSQGQLLTKKTGIQVIVQPAQGPKAVPSLLENGDGELANLSSVTHYWAYTGTGDYSKPLKSLRVLQSGSDTFFGLITRQDTGIKTIPDLKGKRVTSVPTAPPVKEVMEMELNAYGLNPAKDITLLKAEDTTVALRDLGLGRTDAVSCSLSGAKIVELAAKTKIVVLPFPADKAPLLQKALPGMFSVMTPDNLPGIDPGVPAVATPMMVIARADVNNEVIYRIVKTLIENYNELKVINPVMAEWQPEVAVREFPFPYHPGAIKYFAEKGIKLK